MRRYLPFAIIGVIFCLAIGSGLALFRWKQQQQPSQTAPIVPIVQGTPGPAETQGTPGTQGTPAGEQLHIRGGATARVTLEEYGDFQCPPCGRLFPVLTALEHDYGDRLRVIFRHKPLHQHQYAVLAACAAEAAALQGRFWEMHDLLFQNSLRWTKGVDTVEPDASPSRRLLSKVLAMEGEVRDVFLRYAEILKLDVERFKHDMDSDKVKARVESDRAHGDALGIDRTPTIYVNGRLVPAPASLSEEGLRAVIDAALTGKTQEGATSPSPAATPEERK
jgi:protein-disulfide isomerase